MGVEQYIEKVAKGASMAKTGKKGAPADEHARPRSTPQYCEQSLRNDFNKENAKDGGWDEKPADEKGTVQGESGPHQS